MIVKNIKDIIPGDILEEDVIHKNIFLIKKGTELSKRMIKLLKKRNIETIIISATEPDVELLSLSDQKQKSTLPVTDQNKAQDTFFELLSLVGFEHRYGKLLNEKEDVKQLIQLFANIHINHKFMDMLYALKNWDYYAFIHSFDVFVLGTLLATRQEIHTIDSVALGYLFHDIGKIDIPQDILDKKGKLTLTEFEQVQKHTIKGEAILNSLGQDHIAYIARSHHERLDGTGYPDKLSEKSLSTELRILHIVDVYSALTLKRSYKNALPAQEALQILMQDVHKYDKNILNDFINALAIYPVYSTVLLSDQTTATINRVSKHIPTLPIVKRIDQDVAVTLPVDFSLTISKMIQYQSNSFQTRFKAFLNDLMDSNTQGSSERFTQLIDRLQLEDIYTKIFLPAYWEITKMLNDHNYDTSQAILIELLEKLELEMKGINNYKCKVGILVERNYQQFVPLKIMSGLLHIEGVFPVIINSSYSSNQIDKYVIDNNIESVCVVHFEDRPVRKYNTLQSSKLVQVHISFKQLEKILTEITGTQNRAINFYRRLFNHR